MSFKFSYICWKRAYREVANNSQISVARIMFFVLFILNDYFEFSVQSTCCHHLLTMKTILSLPLSATVSCYIKGTRLWEGTHCLFKCQPSSQITSHGLR